MCVCWFMCGWLHGRDVAMQRLYINTKNTICTPYVIIPTMKKLLVPFLIIAAILTFIKIGFALSGSVYSPSEKQLLVDGDMETSGTTSWTATNAVISKQTGNPHGGNRVLRVAYDGANATGRVGQTVLTLGKTYRFTGWARGDGTSNPCVGDSSCLWSGTASTAWQRFDYTAVAIRTDTRFYGQNLSAGHYVEFDDIMITEYAGYTQVQDTQTLVGGDMEGMPVALADAAMEASGTASWTGGGSETKAKVAGNLSGVGAQYLRITQTAPSPLVYQTVLTSGKTYRVRGWARGDGTANPKVSANDSSLLWTGTSSVTPQYFDYTAANTGTQFRLWCMNGANGNYCDFDDISIVDVGTTSWSTAASVLSKQTTNPHGDKYLFRIAADGTQAYYFAYQNVLTMGKRYRAMGWARGDGTASPRVYMGGSMLAWTGTNSTSWQRFDVSAVATGNTWLYLGQAGLNSGYVEFDDVMVFEEKGKVQVIEKQVLGDGDMELTAATTTAGGAWMNSQAYLSKRTASPHGGNRVLRVQWDGIAGHTEAVAYQIVFTPGKTYRVTGWARADAGGVAYPLIYIGVASYLNPWTGTASNAWQHFDFKFTAPSGDTFLLLYANLINASGRYVEWDDVFVTLAE